MALLIAGLAIFLGVHSVRVFADDWRSAQIAAHGERRWKGLYTLASFVGLGLIVFGYGMARQSPVVLYQPAVWTRHLSGVLVLVAFWLAASAYVPANHLRAAVGHPLVLGTKVWAVAHLLSNGTLADVVLFGGFLLWAVLVFRSARARDRAAAIKPAPGRASKTAIAIIAGTVIWALFAFVLHGWLFGVRPFG